MADVALSVITPDVSENCLGRALLLADLLSHEMSVQVVGVRLRDRIWPAAESWQIPVVDFPLRSAAGYARAARWLRQRVAGSRVIVSKPRPTSLGLALLSGIGPEALVLDIDDWEVGFRRPARPSVRRWLSDARDLVDPTSLNAYWPELALDRVSSWFPNRVVSNRWLERRFGGRMLPHVRDTDALDPARVDRTEVRRELAMDGRVWVGFIGTARAHKGVEDLVDAVAELDEPGLFLAGVDANDAYVQTLVAEAERRLGKARLRVFGQFGFAELARWVSAPDIVCVPSRDEPGAVGQIPAKLFDAMAMGKAIVASRVNDMQDALDGVGVVVEPGDTAALARAIDELGRDEARRNELGRLARDRAIARYSYRAARETLRDALKGVRPP